MVFSHPYQIKNTFTIHDETGETNYDFIFLVDSLRYTINFPDNQKTFIDKDDLFRLFNSCNHYKKEDRDYLLGITR